MAIEIFCPFCGSKTNTRTSERPSLLLVQATVNCPNCGQLKAEFIGQLTNVKRAVYIDCPEVTRWEKTEKEQLKEAGKRPLTNEERLNKLKQDASGQKWLFVDEEAEAKAKERAREKTPLERQQARQAVSARYQ